MKLRELLKKLRLRPLTSDGKSMTDANEDALSSAVAGASAPPNWVPSQQDEGPRH